MKKTLLWGGEKGWKGRGEGDGTGRDGDFIRAAFFSCHSRDEAWRKRGQGEEGDGKACRLWFCSSFTGVSVRASV